jgi:hypothetical protein
MALAAQNTTGEIRPEGRPDKLDDSSSLSQAQRAKRNGVGIDTQKKLDKLARCFHDLHEQVKAGTLSVHRASIHAGFVKEGPMLDTRQKVWTTAATAARQSLHRELRST